MLATTTTCAKPPVMCPTIVEARLTRRLVTPPVFISSPAAMKNGTASSGNDSMPFDIFWTITNMGTFCCQR